MIALIGYGNGLLGVNGGLTTDPNCCCDPPPPPEPCPPCCVSVDWGAFNIDGDLAGHYIASGIPISVKIIMPTKHSRIVCDNDTIQVQLELDAPADIYGAWARFGVAWMFNGESPLVEANGETYPWGLVDWVGTSSSTFSVALQFRKCFLDSVQFHGYIYIGTDFPDWELEIDISRCISADLCCEETVACVDCCALLDQEGVIVYDGKYYKVVDSLDADDQMFTAIMEIELAVAGLVCLDGGVDIALHLVPPRHSEIENRTVVAFPAPWTLGPYAPAINPGGGGEETAIKLDWGTLTAYRYDISLSVECDACDPVLTFPTITVTNTTFNFVGNIIFEECEMTDCCPTPCSYVSGIFNTGQVSTESREDDEGETCSVDSHWKVNGDNAFIHPRFGGDMNFGCTSANWVVVRCSTIAEPGGVDGYEATFSTTFQIAEGACLSRIKLVGEYSADNYVVEGQWKVNGVDQSHIPHGSFDETTTTDCVEFEINNTQGNFQIGTNTIEIRVKNGWVGSGETGFHHGLLLSYVCNEVPLEEP